VIALRFSSRESPKAALDILKSSSKGIGTPCTTREIGIEGNKAEAHIYKIGVSGSMAMEKCERRQR